MDIPELLEEIETLEPNAREKVRTLVAAILEFHREGLERILELSGSGKISSFVQDERVDALLTLHDLHVPPDVNDSSRKSRALSQLTDEEEQGKLIPLSHLVRKKANTPAALSATDTLDKECCDLCGAPIASEHAHLIDPESRGVACACGACAMLFSATDTKMKRKLVRPKREKLPHGIPAASWNALNIPVDLAFFWESSEKGRIMASYPGPAGAVESSLSLERWSDITRTAALPTLIPDVEAVIINKTRGANDAWVVSIDRCYALIGEIRSTWRGVSGGDEVARVIARAFE